MALEIKLGDIVRLRKKHPCGSYDWEVVRLGALRKLYKQSNEHNDE